MKKIMLLVFLLCPAISLAGIKVSGGGDWSQLRGVPAEFADGTDDTGASGSLSIDTSTKAVINADSDGSAAADDNISFQINDVEYGQFSNGGAFTVTSSATFSDDSFSVGGSTLIVIDGSIGVGSSPDFSEVSGSGLTSRVLDLYDTSLYLEGSPGNTSSDILFGVSGAYSAQIHYDISTHLLNVSTSTTFTGTVAATLFSGSGNSLTAISTTSLSASGTASASTYLRGDNSWATPSGSGDAVLAATQTWTGANSFQSSVTINGPFVINATGGSVGTTVLKSTNTKVHFQVTDTSDNDFAVYESSAYLDGSRIVVAASHTATVVISSGTGWNSLAIPVFTAPPDTAITIQSIYASALPAGTSVQFNLEERAITTVNTAGTDVFTVADSTANDSGVKTVSFANAGVDATDPLVFTTPASGAGAGSPAWVYLTIYYTKDNEQ